MAIKGESNIQNSSKAVVACSMKKETDGDDAGPWRSAEDVQNSWIS
jgi:hypothetical protein